MPGFDLEALAIKAALLLGLCLALWGAWHEFTGHYIDIGRAQVQAKWDADKAAREKALTDMTLLWNQKRIDAEKAQQEADHERELRMQDAVQRAQTLPPDVAAIRVPAVAVRVPNDALGGPAAAPGPATEPATDTGPSAADSDVGLVIGWIVGTVIPLYESCRDEVKGWQAFYSSLQATQPEVKP